ncbi:hypothetical protein NLI96_g11783 [Meripilus lineatus]|uniref:Protein kinase domain-containing protein n=1 Tax=Meripilus lineatus TaxID=2056292 RepID=A0AAD5URB2_9APHY|nr:hypothetical protein NLI96_g11783 [Physisporinus lineatus]
MYVRGVQSEFTHTIGRGSNAEVYYGTFEGVGVVIKYLHHGNIIKFRGVWDSFASGNPKMGPCIILEWAENSDMIQHLDALICSGLAGDTYLRTVNKWVRISISTACSLGIAHGDLRGANVLINAKGKALLADFGDSVIADVGGSSTEQQGLGRIPWKAPELLRSRQGFRPTCESDIYAFGCTCVEVYSDGLPWEHQAPAKIMSLVLKGDRPLRPSPRDHGIHDELWALVEKCWNQQPSKRPDADEIIKKLPEIFPYLAP